MYDFSETLLKLLVVKYKTYKCIIIIFYSENEPSYDEDRDLAEAIKASLRSPVASR